MRSIFFFFIMFFIEQYVVPSARSKQNIRFIRTRAVRFARSPYGAKQKRTDDA